MLVQVRLHVSSLTARISLLAPVVTAMVFLSACGGGNSSSFSTPPPSSLVTTYTVNAPAGSSAFIEFGQTTSYGQQTSTQTAPPGGGQLSFLVAGMRPSKTYHMRAHVTLSTGAEQFDPDRTFTTGSIPSADFPSFKSQGDTASGRGIQMMNLTYPANSGQHAEAIATDLAGNVIWYYEHDTAEGTLYPIKLLANGHLLLGISDSVSNSVMREIDLAGNTISELTVQQLNSALVANGFTNHTVQYFHHDLVRLANGHTLIMFAETRQLSGLLGVTGTVKVIGDGVVDVDANYKPVWLWSSFDHLDVNRHPLSPPPDWTHANAIALTKDGNLLFSMRNQHWVIKIDYENGAGNGNVLWRLGVGGDFAISTGNNADWFYGQHYPNIISTNGSVMRMAIFDDGNDRPLPDGSKCSGTTCYSRAVIYDVDEAAKTATVVWQDLPDLFTFWGGSINTPPDGNIVYDLPAPAELAGSRVLEVSRDIDPAVVWQMDVSVPYAYRAVRYRSLYPGVQW